MDRGTGVGKLNILIRHVYFPSAIYWYYLCITSGQGLVTGHPRPRHKVKVGHNQDWGLGLHTAGIDTRTNQQRPDVEDMLKWVQNYNR